MSYHPVEYSDVQDLFGGDDLCARRDYEHASDTYTLSNNVNIFSGTYSRPVEFPQLTEPLEIQYGITQEHMALIIASTASASGSSDSMVASSSSYTNTYATSESSSESHMTYDPAYPLADSELPGDASPPPPPTLSPSPSPPPSPPSPPRNLNVPALPIELWREIIALATDVPGIDLDAHANANAPSTTETQDLYAFVTGDPHGLALEAQYLAALETKTALARVSRYLNRIVQEFLYRYICMRSTKQVKALAYSVERRAREEAQAMGQAMGQALGHGAGAGASSDAGTADAGGQPLFHIPVRLQLALEATHTWSPADTAAMQSILAHCPNLSCFSSAFCTADPWAHDIPTIVGFLRYPGGGGGATVTTRMQIQMRVRRLEVKVDRYVLQAIEEHLAECLEVLYLVPGRRLEPLDSSRKYLLPKVHTLALSGPRCDPYVRMLELPGLRTCIMGEAGMSRYRPFGEDKEIDYRCPRGPLS